jgi:hypothetical protein
LPLLLALVLIAIVAVRWANQPSADSPASPPVAALPATVKGKSVTLEIDFGGERIRRFPAIGWFPKMTVEQLMLAASQVPDGIRITSRGTGELTLLTGVDGVENASAGGRFWLYKVNDQLADRSFAVYELQPGDRVLWTFSAQE